jgi:hypothetical protein
MKARWQQAVRWCGLGLLWLCLVGPLSAQAHLMVAQRGTLNVVGDGVFMVLSLPVSALPGVDDDGDGLLSVEELRVHRRTIALALQRGLVLRDEQGPRTLDGLIVSLSPADESSGQPAAQLVVMGRFGQVHPEQGMRFVLSLFGRTAAEQTFQVTATRANKTEAHLMVLSPDRPDQALFPSAWTVARDFVQLGAAHILTGADHLLFLLVVLAAGWHWRQVVLALTTFTVGHALTLMASVLGGWSVAPAVVEPAIAATIVVMAVFDQLVRRRGWLLSPAWRLSLVGACALIHGLGLASALSELGLDSAHQGLSLASFNLGIEAGQLGVAAAAGLAVWGVQRLFGAATSRWAPQLASAFAIGLGSLWFVQRLAGAG